MSAVQQVFEAATAWTPSAAKTIITHVTCVTAGMGCDVAANNVHVIRAPPPDTGPRGANKSLNAINLRTASKEAP